MKFISFLIVLIALILGMVIFAPTATDNLSYRFGGSGALGIGNSIRSFIHQSTAMSAPTDMSGSTSTGTTQSGIITQAQGILKDTKETLDSWIGVAVDKTHQAKELKDNVAELNQNVEKVQKSYQDLKTFTGITR